MRVRIVVLPWLLAFTLACAPRSTAETAAPDPADIVLSTVPASVYKLRDPGRMRTESWLFHLVVADRRHREGIRPLRLDLEIHTGETLRETISLPESTLALKRTTSYRIPAGMDTIAYQRRFTLEESFDLRLPFLARPQAWSADRVRVRLALAMPGGGTVTRTFDVPLRAYAQKTALVFPLTGPVMVSQGQFNNAGHAGHSNQFAIDVLGLNAEYGPMAADKAGNEEYAGFGREVLAPAGGTVVHARNDVPDNTGEGEPADTYRKLPEPMLAIPGNSVVIDHGNGEFSALMHMMQGSVKVAVGDRVEAGQAIGRLGNSGDANGPHLHYQLQDGPELLKANSLPATFTNVPNADFSRGSFFRVP